MGRVEDGQPVDDLGVVHRERPGGGPTPVVADHERGLGAALLDETADVGGQLVGAVGGDAVRLGRQVVPPQVGRDDAEARCRERRDLQPPAVPELREAVQQDDQRPVAGLDVMQPHVPDLGVALPKFGPAVRHKPGQRIGRAHENLLLDVHGWSFLTRVLVDPVRGADHSSGAARCSAVGVEIAVMASGSPSRWWMVDPSAGVVLSAGVPAAPTPQNAQWCVEANCASSRGCGGTSDITRATAVLNVGQGSAAVDGSPPAAKLVQASRMRAASASCVGVQRGGEGRVRLVEEVLDLRRVGRDRRQASGPRRSVAPCRRRTGTRTSARAWPSNGRPAAPGTRSSRRRPERSGRGSEPGMPSAGTRPRSPTPWWPKRRARMRSRSRRWRGSARAPARTCRHSRPAEARRRRSTPRRGSCR